MAFARSPARGPPTNVTFGSLHQPLHPEVLCGKPGPSATPGPQLPDRALELTPVPSPRTKRRAWQARVDLRREPREVRDRERGARREQHLGRVVRRDRTDEHARGGGGANAVGRVLEGEAVGRGHAELARGLE